MCTHIYTYNKVLHPNTLTLCCTIKAMITIFFISTYNAVYMFLIRIYAFFFKIHLFEGGVHRKRVRARGRERKNPNQTSC